jgi:uncharacterized membrane protein
MRLRDFRPGMLAIVAALGVGLVFRDRLPEQVPMHWNIAGEVDRWGPRGQALVLLPGIGLLLAGLFVVLPKIDPRRESHALHGHAYRLVGNAALVFMAGMHLVVLAASAGYAVPMNRIVGIGVGLLFTVIGNVLTQARPNWIFGIRTPWTLSSEKAWRETHRVGGRLMVGGGLLIVLAGILVPQWIFAAIMIGVVGPSLAMVVYSYLVWKREHDAMAKEG